MVLGHTIKAGGGQDDGERVLDILARHPSTARFIATKLARRFVADKPPPALVDRAAKRFHDTDGDIREVVRTIVTSPEFFAADGVPRQGQDAVRVRRQRRARDRRRRRRRACRSSPPLRDLGMPLYMCQPPTGYADRADAWVNTGALLAPHELRASALDRVAAAAARRQSRPSPRRPATAQRHAGQRTCSAAISPPSDAGDGRAGASRPAAGRRAACSAPRVPEKVGPP